MPFSVVIAELSAGYAAYEANDYKTALQEFRPLANQGNAKAQLHLGGMYKNGRGVIQDYKQSVKWYALAANQGNAIAQLNLGTMYAKGKGVTQDYVTAHMWYNVGASNGLSPVLRDLIAKKMTPSQLEQAQQKAREWVAKHSN